MPTKTTGTARIRLVVGGDVATATLEDSAAVRAFAADDGQAIASPASSAWAPSTPAWR